jgi:hypothetical protein
MARIGIIQALMLGLLGALSFFATGVEAVAIPPNDLKARDFLGWFGGHPHPSGPEENDKTWFNLQSFVVDQRYHTKTPNFISFAGGDASTTNNSAQAAKFWNWKGQLGVGNRFVRPDFSGGYAVLKLDKRPSFGFWNFLNGKDGWLHMQGHRFSYGQNSQAIFCQSGDGAIFLQGQNKPPFPCRDIGVAPRRGMNMFIPKSSVIVANTII